MTARWPLELPQYPLRDGLDVEPLDTDVRGETDTGPGTVRAAELGEWNKVRCTVALRSREERDRLLQWHRDDLVGGTQEFDWPELDASVGDLSYRYMFTAKPKRVPRGVTGWRMALELMTMPAPPPVGFVRDGALGDYIATVTRPVPVTYYAADLSKQIAAIDASAIDYDPVDGRRRGQRLNSGDYIDCSLVALDEEGGTLRYTEEPMTTADRTVHEITDDSGSSAVRLAVENGRYVFTVVNAGTVVAALDTGVAPAIFQRQQIVCAYSRDRIIAIASGGEAVVATGGNIPPVDTLTRWRVGGTAATPGQCWVVDFDYIGRAEHRPAAGAVDVIRDELVLIGENYLSPYASFTANTTRTYRDANGLLQTAAINQPRFDHDPATGERIGLLLEQQAVNLFTNSQDPFAGATSTLTGTTPNAGIDLFGNQTVRELRGVDSGDYMFREFATVANRDYVVSAHIDKASTTPSFAVFLSWRNGSGGQSGLATINLSTGAVTGDFTSAHAVDCGRLWRLVIPTISTDGTVLRVVYYPNRSGNGADDRGALVTGAQLEEGKRATSYCPAVAAAATRAKDDLRLPDLTPFNGLSEGAFVVEYETQLAPSSLDNRILSRGANGRLLSLRGPQGAYSYDGNSVEIVGDGISEGSHIFALAFGNGTQSLCINGGAVKTAAWNGAWGSGDLLIGEINWSGWIKPLRWIPRRVSDAELQQLSQIGGGA